MAATGSTRLLRAASVALGGARRQWLLLASPHGGPNRTLSASGRAWSRSEDKVTVHFVNRDGETLTTQGKIGDSLLDVVVDNNLDIDGFDAAASCFTSPLGNHRHSF